MPRMKKIINRLALTPLQSILITAFYLLVICLFAFVDNGAAFRGIEPPMISGEVDYLAFSRWLLLMSAPILTDGYLLLRAQKARLYMSLRMKNHAEWYHYTLTLCLLNTLYWSVLLLPAILFALPAEEAVSVWLLLLFNNFVWLMLTLLLSVMMKGSPTFGVVAILILGVSFLLGEFVPRLRPWTPGAWSMICRTAEYWSGGGNALAYLGASAVLALVLFGVFRVLARSNPYKEF